MLLNLRRSKCNDRFFFYFYYIIYIMIFCILNFMENCLEIFKKYFLFIENLYFELVKLVMDEELIKNVLYR